MCGLICCVHIDGHKSRQTNCIFWILFYFHTLVRKCVSIKLYKIFWNFFYVNLLINIVYYVYIDLCRHIYIPNQAIRAAKLCFYCFFFKKYNMNAEITWSWLWPWALIFEEPTHIHLYVPSTCIQHVIKIHQWKLWEIPTFKLKIICNWM